MYSKLQNMPGFTQFLIGILVFANQALAGEDKKNAENTAPSNRWEKHYYHRIAQFEKENLFETHLKLSAPGHFHLIQLASFTSHI